MGSRRLAVAAPGSAEGVLIGRKRHAKSSEVSEDLADFVAPPPPARGVGKSRASEKPWVRLTSSWGTSLHHLRFVENVEVPTAHAAPTDIRGSPFVFVSRVGA